MIDMKYRYDHGSGSSVFIHGLEVEIMHVGIATKEPMTSTAIPVVIAAISVFRKKGKRKTFRRLLQLHI